MIKIRLALRALFKSPFLTIVAIVSLALGIGANAAIYSLFDQLLRRPMPVAAPDMLVNLSAPGPKPGSTSCSNAGVSGAYGSPSAPSNSVVMPWPTFGSLRGFASNGKSRPN